MAIKRNNPEAERRDVDAKPKSVKKAKQPPASEIDMDFLIKNYSDLGFKEKMKPAELKTAMKKLAENTRPLNNQNRADALGERIKPEINAAIDAVRAGAPQEELDAEFERLRLEMEEALQGEDKKTIKATTEVIKYNALGMGDREREQDLAQKPEKPQKGDMDAALKQAGKHKHPKGLARHDADHDGGHDFEPPAKLPKKLAKAPVRGDDEPNGPPPARRPAGRSNA